MKEQMHTGDPSGAPPTRAQEFDILAARMRRAAEAMIGDGSSAVPLRLRKAARALRSEGESSAKLNAVADELESAANALDAGLAVPHLTEFSKILQMPISGNFYARIPTQHLSEWRLMHNNVSQVRESLARFSGAAWLASVGPTRAETLTVLLTGDQRLASDLAVLSTRAAAMAESALLDAGVALMGVSRLMYAPFGVMLAAFGICDDDCVLGQTQDCTASEVTFAPYGDSDTDSADFDHALAFLKILSYTPKVPLSPGGGSMIREIVKGLRKLKEASDKLAKDLDGYSVFVRLTYQECVSGYCGTYWSDKSKVVEVPPPPGKKHSLGKGWKQSVIDNLGQDDAATAAQMAEFQKLAQKSCP